MKISKNQNIELFYYLSYSKSTLYLYFFLNSEFFLNAEKYYLSTYKKSNLEYNKTKLLSENSKLLIYSTLLENIAFTND